MLDNYKSDCNCVRPITSVNSFSAYPSKEQQGLQEGQRGRNVQIFFTEITEIKFAFIKNLQLINSLVDSAVYRNKTFTLVLCSIPRKSKPVQKIRVMLATYLYFYRHLLPYDYFTIIKRVGFACEFYWRQRFRLLCYLSINCCIIYDLFFWNILLYRKYNFFSLN